MKNYKNTFLKMLFLVAVLGFNSAALAQDDLMQLLEEEKEDINQPVIATFKSSRIINGHSIETRNSGALEFIISHRFGTVNSGVENFFGLDEAWIRLGLDYAVTDNFTVGIGRSSFRKTYDGFIKYKFLSQKTGVGSPVTVTGLVTSAIDTQDPPFDIEFKHQVSYTAELLIARKFSQSTSIQLMPVWVHRNLVQSENENNDILALGIGGRQKLTKRTALTYEYYYQFDEKPNGIHNSIGIGVDIETGGHVFQIHITNSTAIVDKEFITNTTNDFWDGDIHIGFNVVRIFQLKKDKQAKPFKEDW